MIHLRGQLIRMTYAKAEAARTHLPAHIRQIRAEARCLMFDVSATDDPMVYEVMEAFRDRPSFDAHQPRTRDSA